jgi:hypothetical protein
MLNSIIDLLSVMSVAHFQAKQAVSATYANDKTHTSTWIEEKKQQKREEVKNDFLDKLLNVHERLRVEGDAVLQKIGRICFPLSTHPVEASRTAGELQAMSAMLTIQQPLTSASKLDMIQAALSIGRVDFAWTIINAEKARIASRMDSVAPVASDTALLKAMNALVARWNLSGELAGLLEEKALIPQIEQRVQEMERFVLNPHLTGQFIATQDIEGMSQEAVRENLASINFIMSQ